ncbi:MAG: (2Fe-2S)-binding protein, partial [Pseudomonadota bacterium]|nr:(2Fe-2S)-binding protein [Pseudomonadota bacterium]
FSLRIRSPTFFTFQAMYICLCQAVTDRDIQASVDAGAESLDDVQATLPVALNCGTCRDSAEALINEALQNKAHKLSYAA